MDGTNNSAEYHVIPEPRGMTIADLVALVLGVSIIMVMPWFGWQPRNVPWLRDGWDWDRVYMISGHMGEATERLALAFCPVVFARRLRYGGVLRSGEFLIPFVSLQLLLTPRAGMPKLPALETAPGRWGTLIVLVLSILAICLGRRRLPGSVNSALLVFSALLFAFVDRGLDDLLSWLEIPESWDILMMIDSVPGQILYMMPLAAAIFAGGRDRRRSWLEWAGMGLILAWLVLMEVHSVCSAMLSDPVDEFLKAIAIGWVTLAISFVVGAFFVRRFGPSWRGWIDSGTSPERSGIRPAGDSGMRMISE